MKWIIGLAASLVALGALVGREAIELGRGAAAWSFPGKAAKLRIQL